MEAKLIKIGNSQGIRIPKPILEQCGFEKMVNIEVRGHTLIIKATSEHRKGWDKAFRLMHKNQDDQLLDKEMSESEFDQKEWSW
jgi:antitoxin MazE